MIIEAVVAETADDRSLGLGVHLSILRSTSRAFLQARRKDFLAEDIGISAGAVEPLLQLEKERK